MVMLKHGLIVLFFLTKMITVWGRISFHHRRPAGSFIPVPIASSFRSNHQTLLSTKNTNTPPSSSFHSSITNQQIVARRNEINRAKRQSRQKALEKDRQRNDRLRHLFAQETQGNTAVPPMYAVKLVTDKILRSELKMNGREKRGRMFVERPLSLDTESDDELPCTSLKALKQTIHEFFRRLKRSTYTLSAGLPTLDDEGNVLMYDEDSDNEDTLGTWSLQSDEDVMHAFQEAEQFFLKQQKGEECKMKRPALVLYVTKDPNAPLPPPPPPYLTNMPDPQSSPSMTMLSFYSFPPNDGIADPESTADQLKRLWRPFRALGRVYVAHEGVNAQMAVPTNVLQHFLECNTLTPEKGGELSHVLGDYMENGINIDPVEVPMEEFTANPAFKKLHIRVRGQIVADGLDKPLDWQNAGYDMPPMEWHNKLKEAKEKPKDSNEPLPIVFDCRNDYETQVSLFV